MNINLFEVAILVAINAFSVFLIIVVLANSIQDRLYRWFIIMTIFLIGWVDFAYVGYLESNLDIALFAYRLNWGFVSAFFFAIYVFYIDCFLGLKQKFLKIILFILSSGFVVLSIFTDLVIQGVVRRDWGNEILFGPLDPFFNLFSVLVTGVLVYFFVSKYISLPDIERRKVVFFLLGTFFLIIFNVVFNVLSPLILQTAQYQHFGDYSAIFFLGFTAYAMLRYRFLDIKVLLTASLISIIGVLLFIDIVLLSRNLVEQGIKGVIFLFFVGISNILIRSILNEIRQREELQKAYKQVQGLRQHEQDMIDIMGHELRTPITIVRNSLGVMEMEFKKNGTIPQDKLARYLDIAMESARREVRLVETLLSSAKADSRGFQLMFEKVDVLDVVNDSMELFKKEGAKKGLEVVFNTTGEFLAYADRIRTQEIVDNLLSNAVKYTDKGKVEVSLLKDENNLTIEVADTGIGMTEDDIKKLGKKFYRVDQYITKANEKPEETKQVIRPGGTGLGLYVAFSLTKIMDGSYAVQSELGKGSKFIIRLPLYKGQLNMQEQRKVEDDEVDEI